MNGWDRILEWLATLMVASIAWGHGLIAVDSAPRQEPAIGSAAAEAPRLIFDWAQEGSQPQIEPTVAQNGDDVETLDDGTPPSQATDGSGDVENLDTGTAPSAPADEGDVETLDQGAPPTSETSAPPTELLAPVAETAAPAPEAAAPMTETAAAPSYSAPAEAAPSGPVLPPGFGTGSVHVAAGQSSFPTGLNDCHVGAVTGRAYVGIDCGENDDAFVGHAPSFQAFPFVTDEDAVATETTSAAPTSDDTRGDVVVIASPARNVGVASDETSTFPITETTGTTSVESTQRARDREPRVKTSDESGEQGDTTRAGGSDVQYQSASGAHHKDKKNKDKAHESGSKNKIQTSSEQKNQSTSADNDSQKSKKHKDKKAKHKDGKKNDSGKS